MTLSTAHRDYLLAAAITAEVIDASGITTREKEPTGIVFPWNDGSFETPLPQLRPRLPRRMRRGGPISTVSPGLRNGPQLLRYRWDGRRSLVEVT